MNQVILVDGTSYIFRAFHALPMLTTTSGFHTGAIFGFCSMIKKLFADHPKTPIILFFDAGGLNFRHALYPAYKANRKECPAELKQQLERIYDIAALFGVPVVKQLGIEADDLIGTVAHHYAQFAHVIISSADKDFCQLLSEKINLENTQEGKCMTPELVAEKYGIKPNQFIDYLALIGDTSDNIPGVPKVGKVTAAKWLNEFGSLDELLKQASTLTGKVAESLTKHQQDALLSRELATIQLNLSWPTSLPHEELPPLPSPDLQALALIYEELDFKTLIPKRAQEQKPAPVVRRVLIDHLEKLLPLLSMLNNEQLIALDIETTALSPREGIICGLALCASFDESYYIASSDNMVLQTALLWLKKQFHHSATCWIAHNWKFEAAFFDAQIGTLPALFKDTMLMSYDLQPQRKHDLKTLALDLLNWPLKTYEEVLGSYQNFESVPLEVAADYGAGDAAATFSLYHTLHAHLQQNSKLLKLYEELDNPFAFVLMRIEKRGICLDKKAVLDLEVKLKNQLRILSERITDYAGFTLNINSPKQLRALLFQQLLLPVMRKTPKGEPSTDEDVLIDLKDHHPIIALILEYRHLEKLRSTYTASLIQQISPQTQRIHTNYLQTGTVTGRLSSVSPNLQNIPVKSTYGLKIRQAFIARPGYKLVSMDYSQIELRLMAHFSQDSKLLEAYRLNQDIHVQTAATIFGLALDEVTDHYRQMAKTVNFGLIYGMTAWGLSKQLHIPRDQAQKIIDAYFKQYPKVLDYMESMKIFAADHGYVTTLLDRKIPIDIQRKNLSQNALRAAINGPLQGTASDLIKKAMIEIDRSIIDHSDEIQLLLQVHDELIFEIKDECVVDWVSKLKPLMEQALVVSVPIIVNVDVDTKWG